ncbi:hypothetical protein DC498_24580 [Terrimonas sp.]|nr:hypothetical protein DC498_24580 [Terrimonas sp.]
MVKPDPVIVELNDPTPGQGGFTIVADNITETENGYEFSGTLGTKTSEDLEFEIGEGRFEVITGPGGVVTSISGTTMVKFPDVGLFGEMLKTYVWKEIEGHIEYETGQYYINNYGTEVPLNPETRYLRFKLYNESRDAKFELRHKLNKLRYHFKEFYLDPLDPAILLKGEISMPDLPSEIEGNDEAAIYWETVSQTAQEAIGVYVPMVDMQAIVGISNQARFTSTPYDFKIANNEYFISKYGYNSFEKASSHFYLRLANIPIPLTKGLLQVTGDMYIHIPQKTIVPAPALSVEDNYDAILDYLNDKQDHGYMINVTGSIDPLANPVADGIFNSLANLNNIVGVDVFNADINLELVNATFQFQRPGYRAIISDPSLSYLRFGGQQNGVLLTDLFGDDIKKHILLVPIPAVSNFFYLSVGPAKDNFSIYREESARIVLPFYGDLDLGLAYFYINKDSIEIGTNRDMEVGPFHLKGETKGVLSRERCTLTKVVDHSFIVDGVELGAANLNLKLDSKEGITMHGDIILPFGLGEAAITGSFINQKIAFSGMLKAGVEIDLGNGFRLPTADMKFSVKQGEGFELEGKVQVPYAGWLSVKGKLTSGDFLLEGEANAGIMLFGATSLPHANGIISISKKNGIHFSGIFDLRPFGNRKLEGSITATEINLAGSFNASVPIGGHTFTFANVTTRANNNGVSITGSIDLYFVSVALSGSYRGANDFTLTGQHNYNTPLIKTTLRVVVTNSSVSITGSGKVYGLLGNELYSGALRFVPNWANKTVSACYTVLNSETCIQL